MTLYFGLPVTCKEAIRILGLNLQSLVNQIKNKYKFIGEYLDPYIIEGINNYFEKQSLEIKIFGTDKGQYIIGYELKEVYDVWNKFVNTDEFILLILNFQKLFKNEMQILNTDLTQVTLEHMEGDSEIVKNPIPYIISF